MNIAPIIKAIIIAGIIGSIFLKKLLILKIGGIIIHSKAISEGIKKTQTILFGSIVYFFV